MVNLCNWFPYLRRQLATVGFVVPHEPSQQQLQSRHRFQHQVSPSACSHIFLHPLTWMRPSLFPTSEEGSPTESPLAGRLTCPNKSCSANIGKFAWPGMQCNCGTWVVPAIALAKARVDVIDIGVRKAGVEGAGIRMPPGMRISNSKGEDGRGLL